MPTATSPSGAFVTSPNNNLRSFDLDFTKVSYTGGGQTGYNYQWKHFLFGLETDFNYSALSKTVSDTKTLTSPLSGTVAYNVSYKVNWFGTARPRIGLIANPALFYLTGGFTYAHMKSNSYIIFQPVGDYYTGSTSKTLLGWNAGGGIEALFFKHWMFRVEYLFNMLQDNKYTDPEKTVYPTYSYTTSLNNKFHIVRMGINYLF